MRLLPLLFLPAAVYQLLAIVAGVLQWLRRSPRSSYQPGVSVLKPVHGLDPDTAGAFRSQVEQNYAEFELLFGVKEASDPAIAEIARLKTDFPNARIRVFVGGEQALNGKVGLLEMLGRHAQFPVWVVNDSDIRVTPSYLSEVVAPLERSSVGLVTCLYRPRPHCAPAVWEALGIATDFMPSTLVAPMVGVREFGLGSTLAFRAEDLRAAGGFAAISEYLADDYQLGRRISRLGKRAVFSTHVVETSLGDDSWTGVWQHQLRWARTIRLSKGKGYFGLPITHAGLWAGLAVVAGVVWFHPMVWLALGLIGLRWVSAWITGWLVLRSPVALAGFLLAPLWDWFAFGLWISSYSSNRVKWRGRTFQIGGDGRILSPESVPVEASRD